MNKIEFDKPSLMLVEGRKHKLLSDWIVTFRGEEYRVPIDFVTDGASIPFWLQPICGDPNKVPRVYAALVHDWLYSGGDREATRADADDLYRDMQIALGVPRWKAYVEWGALRLFGRSHWSAVAKVAMIAAALVVAGCASAPKAKAADVKGMYANAATETLAIGSARITILPEAIESFMARYSEDTAWLRPSTKTHELEIFMTGTNATQKADAVVKSICEAFAASKGSAAAAPTPAPKSEPATSSTSN